MDLSSREPIRLGLSREPLRQPAAVPQQPRALDVVQVAPLVDGERRDPPARAVDGPVPVGAGAASLARLRVSSIRRAMTSRFAKSPAMTVKYSRPTARNASSRSRSMPPLGVLERWRAPSYSTDDAGFLVEQVGRADVLSAPVEDRHGCTAAGQAGVEQPDMSHPATPTATSCSRPRARARHGTEGSRSSRGGRAHRRRPPRSRPGRSTPPCPSRTAASRLLAAYRISKQRERTASRHAHARRMIVSSGGPSRSCEISMPELSWLRMVAATRSPARPGSQRLAVRT